MKVKNSILIKLHSFFFLFFVSIAADAQISALEFCQQQLASNFNSPQSFLSDLRKHIEEETENKVPIYVLGLDEDLKTFYDQVKRDTQHQALYYNNLYQFSFSDHPLKSKLLKEVKLRRKYKSVEEWVPVFEKTMQNWVNVAPNKKTIYFNLAKFNFDKYQQYEKKKKNNEQQKNALKGGTNFTNAEMEFILSDKKIFSKIRWFENDHELSKSEIEKKFKDVAPQFFL